MPALPLLPDDLVRHPFRVRTGYEYGLSTGELRSGRWRRPHHGVRAWADLPASHPAARAHAAAQVLPDGAALTGWAAAWLHGARDLDGRGQPVLAAVPPTARIRRPGIVVIRSPLAEQDVLVRHGVAVTSPVRCAFDLARLTSRDEGVVGLDAMLASGLVTRATVAAYVDRHRRWKGVPQARRVVDLADPDTASPMETRLRMLWLETGLPRPEVNVDVLDTYGTFLGRVDLLDHDAGLVGEYDGAGHRRPDRHAADNRREERLESAGLVVVRFIAEDVFGHRAAARARLRSAWARGRSRDRRRDRWATRPSATGHEPRRHARVSHDL